MAMPSPESSQTDMQEGLNFLQLTMESAKSETSAYPGATEELLKRPGVFTYPHYDFKLVSVSEDGHVIEADGKGDMEGDVRRIDQSRKIKPLHDKCE
jgi:hypothetical protein